MTPYTQILIKYDENKDISAILHQNCLIICCKILLNVLHNMFGYHGNILGSRPPQY